MIDLTESSDSVKQVPSEVVLPVVVDRSKPGHGETGQDVRNSDENSNRFYKFCSINDPRNPNNISKNETRPSEPGTPVLFGENSQEEDIVKEEPKSLPVATSNPKPRFRKREQARSVESLPSDDDDEKDFKISAMDKTLNSSHVEKEISDKQEECHLRTRRGPRGVKRSSTSKPNLRMSKRKKGVEFEDEGKENQVSGMDFKAFCSIKV